MNVYLEHPVWVPYRVSIRHPLRFLFLAPRLEGAGIYK